MSSFVLDDSPPEIGEATDVTRLDHIPTTLRNLPSKMGMPRAVTYRKRRSLPPGYKPGEFDVCCGRGKRHWNHMGNVRFRRFIQSSVERYMDAPSKNDKTAVVVSIVDDIRNMGGCFLKEDLRGSWYDIGDHQAREKVGHSLRDQVSTVHRQQQKQAAFQQHRETTETTTATGGGMRPVSGGDMPQNTPTNDLSAPLPQQQQSQLQQRLENVKKLLPQQLLPQAPFSFDRQQQQKRQQQVQLEQLQQQAEQRLLTQNQGNNTVVDERMNAMNEDWGEGDDVFDVVEEEDDGVGIAVNADEDDDARSDGSNERTVRRKTLSSSMIIDKFARRPSFASTVADPSNSFSTSKSSSKRSSGWSFLNELDFSMVDQCDGDFQDSLEPIQYKSSLH
ncbi:hypothetical protein ACA910_020936 [Epithemia clementina (nom. ined.)]